MHWQSDPRLTICQRHIRCLWKPSTDEDIGCSCKLLLPCTSASRCYSRPAVGLFITEGSDTAHNCKIRSSCDHTTQKHRLSMSQQMWCSCTQIWYAASGLKGFEDKHPESRGCMEIVLGEARVPHRKGLP